MSIKHIEIRGAPFEVVHLLQVRSKNVFRDEVSISGGEHRTGLSFDWGAIGSATAIALLLWEVVKFTVERDRDERQTVRDREWINTYVSKQLLKHGVIEFKIESIENFAEMLHSKQPAIVTATDKDGSRLFRVYLHRDGEALSAEVAKEDLD